MRLLGFLAVLLLVAGCANPATTEMPTSPARPIGPDTTPVHVTLTPLGSAPMEFNGTPMRSITYPTGIRGTEPTVRSTGTGLLLTGSRETYLSTNLVNWTKVQEHPASADPVMAYDDVLHHGIKVDLQNLNLACAYVSTSDDSGSTWTRQQDVCSASMDYLKVAAGPVGPDPNPLANGARSATYICHNLAPAPANPCLTSFDGGRTFNQASTALPPSQCQGINSYPAVRHDGVVAVPVHNTCPSTTILLSRDSGLTWHALDGPQGVGFDSAMTAISFDGDRLVAAWEDAQQTWLAWSDDLASWSGTLSIKASGLMPHFTAMQAHNGTAAVAFLGGDGDAFYLLTGLVTLSDHPTARFAKLVDPVQRGAICAGGIMCTSARNLGDFITSTIHKDAFVVAWTDGCVGCQTAQDSTDRQMAITVLPFNQ